MNDNLEKLMEWSTWATLDNERNKELILLKGHLYLEVMIDAVLSANDIKRYHNLSFYRKINELSKIDSLDILHNKKVAKKLFEINKIRNKLAHEFNYDINCGELENWSEDVLSNFDSMKFTKHTHRTKIVHAFSAMAKAVFDTK